MAELQEGANATSTSPSLYGEDVKRCSSPEATTSTPLLFFLVLGPPHYNNEIVSWGAGGAVRCQNCCQ